MDDYITALEWDLRDAENKIDQLSLELRDAEAMAESIRDFGKWLVENMSAARAERSFIVEGVFGFVIDRYNQMEGTE